MNRVVCRFGLLLIVQNAFQTGGAGGYVKLQFRPSDTSGSATTYVIRLCMERSRPSMLNLLQASKRCAPVLASTRHASAGSLRSRRTGLGRTAPSRTEIRNRDPGGREETTASLEASAERYLMLRKEHPSVSQLASSSNSGSCRFP